MVCAMLARMRNSLFSCTVWPFVMVVVAAGALVVGCGGDAPADDNQPPSWSDAPSAAVVLGQGTSLALPFTLTDPDGDGVEVTQLTVPAGIEALVDEEMGLQLHADYTVAGAQSLTVSLRDSRGAEHSVTLQLEVQPLLWRNTVAWDVPVGPEEREHTTAMVDEANGHTYVFHGSGYHPQFQQMLDDVWRFDAADDSWTQVTPTGDVPSGRGSMRLAMAVGSDTGYLFGGYGDGEGFAELHRVRIQNGTLDFTLLQQTNAPSSRALHAFFFDPETDTFALFGGVSIVSSQVYDDTWTMKLAGDTAVWTEHDLSPRPSKRYGFFYGFDEQVGRLLLFSGAQFPVAGDNVNPARDVWTLDMRSGAPVWLLLMEGDTLPAGRRNGCAVFDPSAARLFVWGGTANGMTTEGGLFVMDARPGHEVWHYLGLDNEPDARSSGLGFFDGESVRMGFGNGNKLYRDLGTLGY